MTITADTSTRLVNCHIAHRVERASGAVDIVLSGGAFGVPEQALEYAERIRGTVVGIVIVDVRTGERWAQPVSPLKIDTSQADTITNRPKVGSTMAAFRKIATALAFAAAISAAGATAASASTPHAPARVMTCHLVTGQHVYPHFARAFDLEWDATPYDIVPPFVMSNGRVMTGQNWNGATAAFWSRGCR